MVLSGGYCSEYLPAAVCHNLFESYSDVTRVDPRKQLRCPLHDNIPHTGRTSAFGDESRPMLKTIQRSGKHFICHLQGEYRFLEALYRAGSRRRVGCDGPDWRSGLMW